jgi:hypothetical protein
MLEQGDSSSESSASHSGSTSDFSERDFYASDVESFVASDGSYLCFISDLEVRLLITFLGFLFCFCEIQYFSGFRGFLSNPIFSGVIFVTVTSCF